MIYIADLQSRTRVPRDKVRRLAAGILGKKSLSVAFVTNAAIRKLNRKFLKHDYVTDVLAFRLDSDLPLDSGGSAVLARGRLFGEVVVSTDYARAEATKRGIPVEEELLRYVAHGVLHLLGYDDHRPADRARMWTRQERLLRPFLKRKSRRGS